MGEELKRYCDQVVKEGIPHTTPEEFVEEIGHLIYLAKQMKITGELTEDECEAILKMLYNEIERIEEDGLLCS